MDPSFSVESENKYVQKEGNSYYRKILSLVHQYQSEDQLWKAAKYAKMKQDLDFCYRNLFTTSFDGKKSELLTLTLEYLGINDISIVNKSSLDIPEETFQLATKIYIYLANCPKEHWYNWDIWMNFYSDLLNKYSTRNVLLTLARILTSSKQKGKMEFDLSSRLFKNLSKALNEKFAPYDPGDAPSYRNVLHFFSI